MGNCGFEHPYAFLLLLLFGLCFYFCKPKFSLLIFPNLPLLRQAGRRRGSVAAILKVVAVLGLVTALASPVIRDEVVVNNDMGYELSLILDASGSMQEHDKFGIVKTIVQDFIRSRAHDKLALSIFADFAYVAVPLTYDKASLAQLLDRLQVGVAGMQRTALYEALYLSSNLFKTSKSKHKIAILLTDGMDNAETIPLQTAIDTAKKYGIKVYTIGIGGRGDYQAGVLNKIAQETDGKFYEANSVERLQKVYQSIDALEKSKITADKYVKKRHFFQYPLGAALAAMALFLIFRNRR